MLGGDQARLRLAYSLLFSLPGAPMLFYGEEIGMGEHLALEGRLSVRAPMQWTPYNNGGFSDAPPEQLVRPILAEGEYGFERVSVGAMRSDPDSLLNWMAALIRTRRECGEIGASTWREVATENDTVLGLRYDDSGSAVVILNNLSSQRQTVTLDLTPEEVATTTDLLGDRVYGPINPNTRRLRIDGYGYRWMRLGGIY
jgi:maltose alpha-D-glucosyltransferase/alpha-amylase